MRYTSDLTDTEWQLIDYCFPKPCQTGRPREHRYRELLNGIFYLTKTACQWRNLPESFAPWGTVYHYFRIWKRNGLGVAIHTRLREQARQVEGRKRQPSAAIIDSQRVKSTETSDARVTMPAKKSTDASGISWSIRSACSSWPGVLPADIQDRDGAKQLLAAFLTRKTHRRVKHIWADGGYTGTLLDWTRRRWRRTIEIVKRSDLHLFKVLPRRWVVERTFGWLGRCRRFNRDYERPAETGETRVYLAMIRLRLKRLR